MSRSERFDCELRIAIPATLEAIEEFFEEFRRRSNILLDRGNCFAAELLVREALTNAVVHGCGANPEKQACCAVRLRRNRLFIAVKDEGQGFDWRLARDKQASVPESSGRGMEILRLYANRVRFNDKGNVVTMIKNIERGKNQ
jgi:anti-sigma regulatory factor (Ser/Thr protein kinase)